MKKKFLIAFMLIATAPLLTFVGVVRADVIYNPGIENGEKYILRGDGTSEITPKGYRKLVLQCKYNILCTLENGADMILSTSSPDGACVRVLGSKSATAKSYDIGNGNVAFGTAVRIDENGNVVERQFKKKLTINYGRSAPWYAGPGDFGWREFVYEPVNSSVYTRLDCQK
jgi:hypothetical protein